MAFRGTPLETLDDAHIEEAFTGALMTWAAQDEQKATRLYLESIDKRLLWFQRAMTKKKK